MQLRKFSTHAYRIGKYVRAASDPRNQRAIRETWKAGKRLYNQYKNRTKSTSKSVPSMGRGRVASVLPTGNVTQGAIKRKGTSVKREGRRKRIKISNAFKKKVKAVLTYRGPNGIVEQRITRLFKPADNQQSWQTASPFIYENVEGWAFSPVQIAQAYDILWSKGGWTFPGTSLPASSIASLRQNTEIHVLEQSYRVNLKNNSARTLRVVLYDVSPKSVQQLTFGVLEFITNELTRTAVTGATGTLLAEARENPTNVVKEVIGFKPKMLSSFSKFFSLDETVIYLEPGKEYNHVVKGPNDMIYKYQKFFVNGAFYNVQKFCKSTLVSITTDLVTDTLGSGVGRITDMTAAGNPYGLAGEFYTYTKLKCPDQTGFQNPTTVTVGAVQPLGQKGYAFAIKNWYSDQNGNIVDIEDENPQAQAANGL